MQIANGGYTQSQALAAAQAQDDLMNQQARAAYQGQWGNHNQLGSLQDVYGVLGNPSNAPKPKPVLQSVSAGLKEIYSDSLIALGMKKNPALSLVQKEEGGVMGYMKDYFVKHRELLMGLTIVVLLDHFIFGGAFRTKIEAIVNGILNNAQKKLTDAEATPAKAA